MQEKQQLGQRGPVGWRLAIIWDTEWNMCVSFGLSSINAFETQIRDSETGSCTGQNQSMVPQGQSCGSPRFQAEKRLS